MLRVTRLDGRPADWDRRIVQYPQKTLFHESCWHAHLLDIHPSSRLDYFELRDGSEVVGLYCLQTIRRFMLPLSGSPLPGTGTNYMGPLYSGTVGLADVVAAIRSQLEQRWVGHLEVASPAFDGKVDELVDAGFDVHRGVTHTVPLGGSEEVAWAAMRSTCRNRVGKARKNGLVAEVTSDESIVDHFQAQFAEVYAKQGMATPFGIARPRSLFQRLLPAGRLLPIWVRNGSEVIAAGLFPFDEKAIYFWGAASWIRAQHMNPNELLHWTVIANAVARSIPVYNMCGGMSQFKDKFGGADVPYNHYSLSRPHALVGARSAYQTFRRASLKVRGARKREQVGTRGGATPSVGEDRGDAE